MTENCIRFWLLDDMQYVQDFHHLKPGFCFILNKIYRNSIDVCTCSHFAMTTLFLIHFC